MAEKSGREQQKMDNHLDLLLIGKSGHGKKSTGNSIIGQKEFVRLEGGDLGHCQVKTTRFKKHDIKVVDIPGLSDPSHQSKEVNVDNIIQAIASSFNHASNGFDAVLLILSYTARFTEEEKAAVQSLKSILGKEVFRKHTVCVFTHGDSFKNDYEDDMDFETWCKTQKSYKELIEDCEHRAVLFDNRTRDATEKRSQLMELLSKVDSIKNRPRYTLDSFHAAEKTREIFLMELKMPLVLKPHMEKNELINERLNRFAGGPPQDCQNQLDGMKRDLSSIQRDLPQSSHPLLVEFRNKLKRQLNMVEIYENTLVEKGKSEMEAIKTAEETTRIREPEGMRQRQNESQNRGEMNRDDEVNPIVNKTYNIVFRCTIM